MIARKHDNTANALERHLDSGHFGAVGVALLEGMLIIGNAESHLTEDGGNQITFVDRRTGSLRGAVQLALGDPAGIRCPGGTDDLSVIDLDAALAGNRTAEIGRIPTQIGPWGIATSPDGRYVVAANRESQRFAREGNTISIIDVENPLGEALFQARQAMLLGKAGSERSRAHPYFWAPFVHVGD